MGYIQHSDHELLLRVLQEEPNYWQELCELVYYLNHQETKQKRYIYRQYNEERAHLAH